MVLISGAVLMPPLIILGRNPKLGVERCLAGEFNL
jgi:hypothetical protein